jgi:hypothetical protein
MVMGFNAVIVIIIIIIIKAYFLLICHLTRPTQHALELGSMHHQQDTTVKGTARSKSGADKESAKTKVEKYRKRWGKNLRGWEKYCMCLVGLLLKGDSVSFYC